MAQFVSYLFALWNWIAAYGLFLVIAINFMVLACVIALAIHAWTLSRRIDELRRASDANARLISKVMQEIDTRMAETDARMAKIDTRVAEIEAAPAAPPAGESPPLIAGEISDAPAIRKELASLQEEIASALRDISAGAPLEFAPQSIETDLLTQRAREEIESLKSELAEEDEAT